MITEKLEMIESKIREQKEKCIDENEVEEEKAKNRKLGKVGEGEGIKLGEEGSKYRANT